MTARGRGAVCAVAILALAVAFGGGGPGRADDVPYERDAAGNVVLNPTPGAEPAAPLTDLGVDTLVPGPKMEEGDIVVGAATAPVIVFEFMSYLCTDCRLYRHGQHPRVVRRLIDSGKIRFVQRDFPLSKLAFEAAVAARCVPAEHYDDAVIEISTFQHTWAKMEDPHQALSSIVLAYGVPRARFPACLENQEASDRVARSFAEGQALFAIRRLPTFFFVVGDRVARAEGVLTLEDFEEIIAALGAAR